MQCQAKGTVCSRNYHVGNYRAHAQRAIKHSVPLQRSPKQFQAGVPVQRGGAASSCAGLWGCGVSVSWIGWIHAACGPAQRHHFEAHAGRCHCCSRRAETSPMGSVPAMGPCSSSCQTGSRSTSGITDLPVSYGIVGGGWFLRQGSGNLSLLPRAMLEQLRVDTLVTSSWGIHAQQAMEQSRPWVFLGFAVA